MEGDYSVLVPHPHPYRNLEKDCEGKECRASFLNLFISACATCSGPPGRTPPPPRAHEGLCTRAGDAPSLNLHYTGSGAALVIAVHLRIRFDSFKRGD